MQEVPTRNSCVRPRVASFIAVFLICFPVVTYAQAVTAMWDPSPPADQVTGYQVCVGTSSLSCNVQLASVGNDETSHTFTPTAGVLQRVAVRAVNASGAGWYSSETTFSIPSLTQPANQSNQVGVAITPLNLSVIDPDGNTLTFAHTGLPTGLTIDSANRRITGTPSAAGTYNVTLFVTDALVTISRSFTWTITNPDRPSHAGASPWRHHEPHQGQTVTASTVTVTGAATDSGRGGNDVASVKVNGQAATNGTASGTARQRAWSSPVNPCHQVPI